VGEHVFLKVNAKKSSLKYFAVNLLDIIGPFDMLTLPTSMNVHNVFHVSLLKKYVHDDNHVIDWNLIHVETKGYFYVYVMSILDKKVMILWNKDIGKVKV
jgi:hypothetical protein